jgi:phosphatidylserine/phosphatidylglycerophosphate/cardiolipin synthase-like enzyme
MLIDDTFTTLGSANLSPRSMACDSELNLITEDSGFTSNARSRVWGNLAGDDLNGGGGTPDEIAITHKKWKDRMDTNFKGKIGSRPFEQGSFILPFRDTGSSAMRVR